MSASGKRCGARGPGPEPAAWIDAEARRQWLDETTPVESLASLLRPYPDEHLTRYAVPALVGSPKNDVPECIVPLPAGG